MGGRLAIDMIMAHRKSIDALIDQMRFLGAPCALTRKLAQDASHSFHQGIEIEIEIKQKRFVDNSAVANVSLTRHIINKLEVIGCGDVNAPQWWAWVGGFIKRSRKSFSRR